MAKTEREIQAAVIKYAKEQGVMTLRLALQPGVEAGWPDTLFLFTGGFPLFIEFKAPGEEPTPKQYDKLQELGNQGVLAMWTDNFEDAKKVIDMVSDQVRRSLSG